MRAAITALVVLAVLSTAFSRPRAQTRKPRGGSRADTYEITTGIAEAMRHLAVDPGETFRILRGLNARFPGRERILSRIGSAHQVTGRADSAEVYFKRALRINPGSVDAGRALGQIYYGRGDDDKGRRVYERLIEANGRSLSVYKVVGSALRDAGRYEEAMRVLVEGRRYDERNGVLTLDIASLKQQVGDLNGALGEYLEYLAAQPRNYRFVRDRMVSALRATGGNDGDVIAYLEKRAALDPDSRYAIYDAMSSHFLERGLLEKAIETALRADGEPGSNGQVLLGLAERVIHGALDRPRAEKPRYLRLGVRALESFTRNHAKQPGTDRAMFMLAGIHAQFGAGSLPHLPADERLQYIERAVSEYAGLSRRYPNSAFAARAYLERGDLLLYTLRRPAEALEAYRSGAVNTRTLSTVFASRIARVHLGTGDVAAAGKYLESLNRSPDPDLVQTAVYYTGLNLAFAGNYTGARDTLAYLAEEAPSSRYTNDAIEMAWIIEEAMQYSSRALEDFLGAVRADMVGDTLAARKHLEAIRSLPVYETLRPRALLRLGNLEFESGSARSALKVLKQFLTEYHDDNLRPDVHRTIARVYEEGLGQYERALHEYEMVLVEYPEYAFLDEVRDDVRRLRGMVEGGTHVN